MAAIVEIPARDWDFHINTGTAGAPTWVEVAAINTWSHSPSQTDADTTTNDDDGVERHMPIRRGHSFTISGLFKEDPSDGTRDAGQEAVETAAAAVGTAGVKQFRITSPGGTTKTFDASYNATIGGGAENAPTTWSCVVKVSGAIVTA